MCLDLRGPHVCHCGGEVSPEGHHSFTCKVSGKIAMPFCHQRYLMAGPYKSGSPQHQGAAWSVQNRRKEARLGHSYPLVAGWIMAWDAIIVHTCACSYITTWTTSVAEQAADHESTLKYGELPSSFTFQPVAIDTLGQFNRSALEFITGNKRETSFLFQKLSICIQRFNLVPFKGTFTTTDDEASIRTLNQHQ